MKPNGVLGFRSFGVLGFSGLEFEGLGFRVLGFRVQGVRVVGFGGLGFVVRIQGLPEDDVWLIGEPRQLAIVLHTSGAQTS